MLEDGILEFGLLAHLSNTTIPLKEFNSVSIGDLTGIFVLCCLS
jgi:hypothetical protein